MKIILASASPRRLQLLKALGYEVTPIAPNVEEIEDLGEMSPVQLCEKNAKLKAEYIYNTYGFFGADVIIAADTLVFLDQKVFGKPKNHQRACEMLSELSGKAHEVVTGYYLIAHNSIKKSHHVTSKVKFRELSEGEISSYAFNPEVLDKCGSYAISGLGASIVEEIEGSISNIIGLPIKEILEDARELLTSKNRN